MENKPDAALLQTSYLSIEIKNKKVHQNLVRLFLYHLYILFRKIRTGQKNVHISSYSLLEVFLSPSWPYFALFFCEKVFLKYACCRWRRRRGSRRRRRRRSRRRRRRRWIDRSCGCCQLCEHP
jgi:hypothetical protein